MMDMEDDIDINLVYRTALSAPGIPKLQSSSSWVSATSRFSSTRSAELKAVDESLLFYGDEYRNYAELAKEQEGNYERYVRARIADPTDDAEKIRFIQGRASLRDAFVAAEGAFKELEDSFQQRLERQSSNPEGRDRDARDKLGAVTDLQESIAEGRKEFDRSAELFGRTRQLIEALEGGIERFRERQRGLEEIEVDELIRAPQQSVSSASRDQSNSAASEENLDELYRQFQAPSVQRPGDGRQQGMAVAGRGELSSAQASPSTEQSAPQVPPKDLPGPGEPVERPQRRMDISRSGPSGETDQPPQRRANVPRRDTAATAAAQSSSAERTKGRRF